MNEKELEFKTKVLLEDGKVYTKEEETEQLETRLKDMNIKYFVFSLGYGMDVFELDIKEV